MNLQYIYICIAIGAIGRSPADPDDWCRSSVLKSPFQSDSLILLCNPDGTLSKAHTAGSLLLLSPKLRSPGAGVAEHPVGEAEHTSKRMQLQMPGRAASPLKQMEVNPVTYGSRWNPFPPANSGSPKPKSKGHWLVSPEIHWRLEGTWHVDCKIWWNSQYICTYVYIYMQI